MKKFKIYFTFEADDNWLNGEVKDVVETVIDPIYHLGDVSVGEINVEEVEVKE